MTSGRCPCELRNEGLLKPSPVSAKKKATGNPAGRPRKIARRDSQDATESYMTASNATDSDAPLTLLRTQLSAVVEWALEEERVKDVGDALNDAIRDMMSRK